MEERKSSTTAKAGLATAIGAGVVALSNANNGCNNGFLGGLFGNNNNCKEDELNTYKAKVAELEAKMYADSVGVNAFRESQSALDKVELRFGELIKDLNTEAVNNRVEVAVLKKENELIKKDYNYKIQSTYDNLNNQISCLSNATENGFATVNKEIVRLNATVNGFTFTAVNANDICKKGCGCVCGGTQ